MSEDVKMSVEVTVSNESCSSDPAPDPTENSIMEDKMDIEEESFKSFDETLSISAVEEETPKKIEEEQPQPESEPKVEVEAEPEPEKPAEIEIFLDKPEELPPQNINDISDSLIETIENITAEIQNSKPDPPKAAELPVSHDTTEVEDPLSALSDEKCSEVIKESAKQMDLQDVLVCGKCHRVYNFLEAFQQHKSNDNCTENDELKETLNEEKKPQIWAFTLWKNTKFKDGSEEETKMNTSWSIYQLWCNLEAKEKESWIKAGENIQALYEIAAKFEQLKTETIKEVNVDEKLESEQSADSNEPSEERDPLGDDSESEITRIVKGKNKVLKPVQLNSKVIINKKPKNYRKAIKVSGDPKTEYPVEKIVSKRYNPRKRTFEYLIKWENFDAEKNSWEPVGNFVNCKLMVEEFEKNWAIQKAQQRLQKSIEKKQMKKQELLEAIGSVGRPQRTSKQKALSQVKQWCGNIEADENLGGKRVYSDDSEDESFEKRLKYEEYSSDSENDTPVVTIKRVQKTQNGVDKIKKVEPITLPDNILIPDSKGIVRINQKQIPSLSSGVYVMSKTAGIIKLDTKTSQLATSGGQTVLKVAPKIGQTSIKVIKKDSINGSSITRTANILKKPPLRNYSGKVYMQKKQNTQMAAKKAAAAAAAASVVCNTDSNQHSSKDSKDDEESDGVEEMDFPTEIQLPAPDSPPPEFTLCPLTGKVLNKDGQPIEPDPEPTEPMRTENIDNLVTLAAADILKDMPEMKEKIIKQETMDIIKTAMENSSAHSIINSEPQIIIKQDMVEPKIVHTIAEHKSKDSILSTALTNANIGVRRTTGIVQKTIVHQQNKGILNRTIVGSRQAPQAIITRISAGNNSLQRSKVIAPRQREQPQIIRKRVLNTTRSLVKRVPEKVYSTTTVSHAQIIHQQPPPQQQQQLQTQVTTFVATPTSGNTVISMPSLLDTDSVPMVITEKASAPEPEVVQPPPVIQEVKPEEIESPVTTVNDQTTMNTISISESEAPLLITGEDGTIYQVAGQNEEGQTILITQGEDGEQQCLLVAPENAGLINQALMKADQQTVQEAEPETVTIAEAPTVEEPLTINTETEDAAADDSQVVAQIVSANPPSPGGTRKVVLMLPDGNFMMTEVTAEQYAALELDK
ncbi:PREDICTED: uncharacterized protein LOC108565618 isoform X2 [Nicrophorus vespilloides]|uniref:Uncharacterized protein LOC108565618 isoform X2 n=1 Tax=Nicrophorus vespilloides TaxID=110193 RepID=A0ABM1N1F6_NICVS|nr:PREDICTED: uncharacterized protein LOC108565618 isoform X2 [Nicrophorus vespilloides]